MFGYNTGLSSVHRQDEKVMRTIILLTLVCSTCLLSAIARAETN